MCVDLLVQGTENYIKKSKGQLQKLFAAVATQVQIIKKTHKNLEAEMRKKKHLYGYFKRLTRETVDEKTWV